MGWRELACTMALTLDAGSSSANTCRPPAITATGAPSSLQFLAKSRAKSAWRAAVTAAPGLGPDWTAWGIAQGRRFDCHLVLPKAGLFADTICTASAAPCKFDN